MNEHKRNVAKEVSLIDFRNNITRLLSTIIAQGIESIEPCDLGDLIGKLIPCDDLDHAEEVYKELCDGLYHRIG